MLHLCFLLNSMINVFYISVWHTSLSCPQYKNSTWENIWCWTPGDWVVQWSEGHWFDSPGYSSILTLSATRVRVHLQTYIPTWQNTVNRLHLGFGYTKEHLENHNLPWRHTQTKKRLWTQLFNMRRRDCTCSWCSMPILMVLIRMAIMMPLLKYLLSTIPHSFILVLCHSSLQLILGLHPPCLPAPFWPFFPFSWFPEWTPSLSVSSTAPSSASSFALRTGPTPSLSDRAAAHWGQPWVAEAAVRAMGDAWSGLLWWGQGAPEMVPTEDVKGSVCKAFTLIMLSESFNAVTYRASWLLSSDDLPFHWPSSPCLLLLLYLFRRHGSPGVSPARCWKRQWFASWPCGGRGRRAGRVPRSSPRVHWPEWRRTNTELAALAWAGAPSAWSLRIGWRSPRGTGWSWRRNPPGRMRVMCEHTVFKTQLLVIPPRINWKKSKCEMVFCATFVNTGTKQSESC